MDAVRTPTSLLSLHWLSFNHQSLFLVVVVVVVVCTLSFSMSVTPSSIADTTLEHWNWMFELQQAASTRKANTIQQLLSIA